MKEKRNRFCEVCPRQLNRLPCEACPLALERINAIKARGGALEQDSDYPGCPWYIASADYNYCFWVYEQTLYGSPATNREICDLLLVDPKSIDKIVASAITTLRSPEYRELLISLMDTVTELYGGSNGIDLSMYLPNEFKIVSKEIAERIPPPPVVDIRKKHPAGLPLHRDGRKVDLYGLYSRKTMAQKKNRAVKDEKTNNNKKDPEKK